MIDFFMNLLKFRTERVQVRINKIEHFSSQTLIYQIPPSTIRFYSFNANKSEGGGRPVIFLFVVPSNCISQFMPILDIPVTDRHLIIYIGSTGVVAVYKCLLSLTQFR